MNDAMKISEAEWRVCQVLWRRSPLPASEIITELAAMTDWNPRTIKTLLNRLVKKNILAYESRGREYHYSPCLSEEECVQAHTESFVKRVFHGAAGAMLSSFLQHQQLSTREILELKAILEKKTAKKRPVK